MNQTFEEYKDSEHIELASPGASKDASAHFVCACMIAFSEDFGRILAVFYPFFLPLDLVSFLS